MKQCIHNYDIRAFSILAVASDVTFLFASSPLLNVLKDAECTIIDKVICMAQKEVPEVLTNACYSGIINRASANFIICAWAGAQQDVSFWQLSNVISILQDCSQEEFSCIFSKLAQ